MNQQVHAGAAEDGVIEAQPATAGGSIEMGWRAWQAGDVVRYSGGDSNEYACMTLGAEYAIHEAPDEHQSMLVLDDDGDELSVLVGDFTLASKADVAPSQDEPDFATSDDDLTALLNTAVDLAKGCGGMDLGIYFSEVLERVETRLARAQNEQPPVVWAVFDGAWISDHTADRSLAELWIEDGRQVTSLGISQTGVQHSDDAAVDRFARAMKDKLAAGRNKGRSGWDDPDACTNEYLARLLVEHLGKANPGTFEDVANFAMMLHQRGAYPKVLAVAAQEAQACPVPEQSALAARLYPLLGEWKPKSRKELDARNAATGMLMDALSAQGGE